MPGSKAVEDRALVAQFAERARVSGAAVSMATTLEAAAAVIAASDAPNLTGRFTATAAIAGTYPPLLALLRGHGLQVRRADDLQAGVGGQSALAAELAGDAGILSAVAGVAETGSVLPDEASLPDRLTGMLSESVFMLLQPEDLVASLDEMGALLSGLSRQGRRYLSMVTGPSRTADIERVLTIGVQGPRLLHIILLTGMQEI